MRISSVVAGVALAALALTACGGNSGGAGDAKFPMTRPR